MKDKESVDVIIRDFKLNPKCVHGPTILFSRKNGKKFFSCSFDRSNSCFHMEYDQFEKNSEEILAARVNYERGSINDLRKLPDDERIFCATCNKFIKSIQSHEFHSYKRIDEMFLQQPSLFLPQLNDDNVNAQYFFDSQSLEFFASILNDLKLSKIVCIGTPRLHDYIRTATNGQIQSILLDIDQRFEAFYPDEFIHYNMLNNFFFNDSSKLLNFLKDESNDNASHHCIFTDPPFAARTELLSQTIKEISSQYFALNRKQLPIFLVFPYFNEAHIKKFMPEMEMLDYQVTYTNHHAFNEKYKGRKEGSPIRLFTNIDQRIIKYPPSLQPSYRYCNFCHRFVAQSNLHCKICKICPSKNGASYRHCNKCIKCVKPNYIHCEECERCVQKANHDCQVYQLHQECWCCHEKGHVEKFCKLMKRFKHPKKNGTCRICVGGKKHNLTECPSKANLLNK